MGLSVLAIKRVPINTASAPRASAATRLAPSRKPVAVLEAYHDHRVRAYRCGFAGKTRRRDFVEQLHARFLEPWDVGFRVTAHSFDHRYAFLAHEVNIGIGQIARHQHRRHGYVNPKGFIGHVTCLVNLIAEFGDGREGDRRDKSQTARVR